MNGDQGTVESRSPHGAGRRRRVRVAALAAVLVAVVLFLLALSWLGMRVGATVPITADAPKAAWLAHHWVGEPIDEQAVADLAARLREVGATDVYAHVGPLDGKGEIPAALAPHAEAFAAALHERLPSLRVQAWLGQVSAGGGGPLDLGEKRTRANVVATAKRFLELGFAGVHYDIEPIWSGDKNFLALLETTADAAHPQGKVVSVAAEELPLFPGARQVIGALIPRYHPWTIDYHQQVARHVDQVAVMTYDSALPLGHVYQRFVARNTRLLARTLPSDVDLLIGVPSYDEWNWGHWPAENPHRALAGLRRGLARTQPKLRSRVGWALYAEWTTDSPEWEALRVAGASNRFRRAVSIVCGGELRGCRHDR